MDLIITRDEIVNHKKEIRSAIIFSYVNMLYLPSKATPRQKTYSKHSMTIVQGSLVGRNASKRIPGKNTVAAAAFSFALAVTCRAGLIQLQERKE